MNNGYQAKLIAALNAHGWSNNRIGEAIGGSTQEVKRALLGERPLGTKRLLKLETLVLVEGLGKVALVRRRGANRRGATKGNPVEARRLYATGVAVADIAARQGVSRKTVYNYLAAEA